MIPYAHQQVLPEDIDAVIDVLRSEFLTTGSQVTAFEQALCAYTGAAHAVAVSSCTAALHLSMLALGIGPTDTVYVSAISFAASANCARYVGARVKFIDVDAYGLMDMAALSRELAHDAAQGTLPKAVVAVDLSGRPCDLQILSELKARYHFHIVEDAAHALGAQYQGHLIGDGSLADLTVLSFHPVKIITTAEGGAILTNDPELAAKLAVLRSHGIVHAKAQLEDKTRPDYYYEMQALGFNYRLSDLHCALGLSQLNHIEDFLSRRRELAQRWSEVLLPLADDGLLTLPPADTDAIKSSWHLYQIRVKQGRRDGLYTWLRAHRIGVQVHYLPIYAQPYYRKLYGMQSLPGADSFSAETLSLPLYPGLDDVSFSLCAAQVLAGFDALTQSAQKNEA